MIESCSLKFASKTYLTTIYSRNLKIRIQFEYSMAAALAEKLKLRALDLLHILYTSMLMDKIKLLVTCDNGILKMRKVIEKFTELKVVHP